MNAVNIFTVKELVTLYKNDSPAERIELLRFEEVGYEVVVGKGTHKVGNKVIFIMPDYCVSDTPIFQDFIAPSGQSSKSYLGLIEGQPRRIRAKKFNFHTGDGKHVYSNGILLTVEEVTDYLNRSLESMYSKFTHDGVEQFLTEQLGITKYEAPEPKGQPGQTGQARKGGFPSGVYKTDETNIKNLWGKMKFPGHYIGTEKVDGSSISIGITDEYPDGFVTSRNINKSFTDKLFVGRRKKSLLEKIMFWRKPDLNLYKIVSSTDMFVVQGLPYIEAMKAVGLHNIILRGELNGTAAKGSGNKHNPANKLETNIKFFYIDKFENGVARKLSVEDFKTTINKLSRGIEVQTVHEYFNRLFETREDLAIVVENIFNSEKIDNKKLIEGIVITEPSNQFSCKYMNDEYDSKK